MWVYWTHSDARPSTRGDTAAFEELQSTCLDTVGLVNALSVRTTNAVEGLPCPISFMIYEVMLGMMVSAENALGVHLFEVRFHHLECGSEHRALESQ